MKRRERPQLVLSEKGQPRYYSSGVEDVADHSFTLVMKVNSEPALPATTGEEPVDDMAPIFHVSPAGCRGGVAPLHHGWTNGAPSPTCLLSTPSASTPLTDGLCGGSLPATCRSQRPVRVQGRASHLLPVPRQRHRLQHRRYILGPRSGQSLPLALHATRDLTGRRLRRHERNSTSNLPLPVIYLQILTGWDCV